VILGFVIYAFAICGPKLFADLKLSQIHDLLLTSIACSRTAFSQIRAKFKINLKELF
jgi:hypothetical protein